MHEIYCAGTYRHPARKLIEYAVACPGRIENALPGCFRCRGLRSEAVLELLEIVSETKICKENMSETEKDRGCGDDTLDIVASLRVDVDV